MPIDGTVLGNVFEEAVCFKGKTFKSRLLRPFCFPLSSFLSLSLLLTLSPSLSLSLFPSLSFSFSGDFRLNRVLADVTNGFANCNL